MIVARTLPDVEADKKACSAVLTAQCAHTEVVRHLVSGGPMTEVTKGWEQCEGGTVGHGAGRREVRLPTTWWWSRARSRAIGICHVSPCIRHSDHPEFVASRRDLRPSFNRTLTLHVHVSHCPTAIAPCHTARAICETLYPRMCSDIDSTNRGSAPRPSLPFGNTLSARDGIPCALGDGCSHQIRALSISLDRHAAYLAP